MKKDITKQGKGKVMKKFILVIMVFILTLSIGICQDKKQEKNAINVACGAFIVASRPPFKPTAEFSPTINIQYNRILWKGLGISVDYSFRKANPNARATHGQKISCIEQNQAISIAPNYRFDIKQFNITPYFAFGICFANFTFPLGAMNPYRPTIHSYYKTETHTCFMIFPGIRFGYDINNWTIFISYNYDYYRCKINEVPFIRIANWIFPESFGHHCFHIGTGIKF